MAFATNLLVYAHRPGCPYRQRARELLTDAVAGTGTAMSNGICWF